MKSSEPVSTVREFIGALVTKGVNYGHIVTTANHFSQAAKELANNDNLQRYNIQITLNSLKDVYKVLQIDHSKVQEIWEKIGK